jgi:hypothetical protein
MFDTIKKYVTKERIIVVCTVGMFGFILYQKSKDDQKLVLADKINNSTCSRLPDKNATCSWCGKPFNRNVSKYYWQCGDTCYEVMKKYISVVKLIMMISTKMFTTDDC